VARLAGLRRIPLLTQSYTQPAGRQEQGMRLEQVRRVGGYARLDTVERFRAAAVAGFARGGPTQC